MTDPSSERSCRTNARKVGRSFSRTRFFGDFVMWQDRPHGSIRLASAAPAWVVGAVDDVDVCNDQPGRIDDDAKRALHLALAAAGHAEEAAENRILEQRI